MPDPMIRPPITPTARPKDKVRFTSDSPEDSASMDCRSLIFSSVIGFPSFLNPTVPHTIEPRFFASLANGLTVKSFHLIYTLHPGTMSRSFLTFSKISILYPLFLCIFSSILFSYLIIFAKKERRCAAPASPFTANQNNFKYASSTLKNASTSSMVQLFSRSRWVCIMSTLSYILWAVLSFSPSSVTYR